MRKSFKLICFSLLCLFLYMSYVSMEIMELILPESKDRTPFCGTVKHEEADIMISPINNVSYLCEFKPNATTEAGGCVDVCTAKGPHGIVSLRCHILSSRPAIEEFKKSDVVVNHYGVNVPSRGENGPPYMTVFYKGESNQNEGVDTLNTYPMYDVVISFQRYQPLHFTYAHRYRDAFRKILIWNNQGRGPTSDAVWSAWQARLPAVAVFVSNCNPIREQVIKLLSSVYEVHSFGECCHNKNVSEKCSYLSLYEQKMCVFRNYKYVLSMENTKEPEYVTEKVYHVLLAGAVPLYWGAPNAEEFVPAGRRSFIDMDEYLPVQLGEGTNASTEGIALRLLLRLSDRLRRIETDKAAAMDLLRWRLARRGEEWGKDFWNVLHHKDPICSICVEAYKRRPGTIIR